MGRCQGVGMQIIDISQAYPGCCVYPGDRAPELTRRSAITRDVPSYNISDISMCLHNGTHIDAPFHTDSYGLSAADLPLSVFFGRAAVVLAAGDIGSAEARHLTAKAKTSRLLLKGKCRVTAAGAREFVKSKIILLGTEGVSISSGDEEYDAHCALLGAGISVLEGLDLRHAEPDIYLLSAFPLKITDADAAPCRAVLIR